jgi:hypothetical protein
MLSSVNLTELAEMQGIHRTTAYRWYREGTLPVPARKAGRLILVLPDTASRAKPEAAGLYARVSSHDQKADLDRQVARLSAWAATVGIPVCGEARTDAVTPVTADELRKECAWAMHTKTHSDATVTAPIIGGGGRTREQLDSAQRALEIRLDAGPLARLDEIFPGYKTAPEHYAW